MVFQIDYKLIIAGIFAGFALLEFVTGRFLNLQRSSVKDAIVELGSGLLLPFAVVPLVFYCAAALTERFFPGSAGSLSHWPWWAMTGILLVCDDLTQYVWHRLSHTWPWLYSLHRAHHSGHYMSVRIVYRNNLLYYAAMPGLWFSGVLLYLGFVPVYYVYAIVKMTVIIGAHSSFAWDEHLYRYRLTRPVMYVLERLISTPATHAAHHGLHADDGATYYKGNYGNLLFLWDVLFGTAKITRRRPEEYGIENLPEANWFEELLWPFRFPGRTGAGVLFVLCLWPAVAPAGLKAGPDDETGPPEEEVLGDRISLRYGIGGYSYANVFPAPFSYEDGRTGALVRPLLGRDVTDIGKTDVRIDGDGDSQAATMILILGSLQLVATYMDYDLRNDVDEVYPVYRTEGGMKGGTAVASAQYTFFDDEWLAPLVTVLYADRRHNYRLHDYLQYNDGAGGYNYYNYVKMRDHAIRDEYGVGLRAKLPFLRAELSGYYQHARNRYDIELHAAAPVGVPSALLVPDPTTIPVDYISTNPLIGASTFSREERIIYHFVGVRLDVRPFRNLILSGGVRKNTSTDTFESIVSATLFFHPNFGIAISHTDFDTGRLGRSTNTLAGPLITLEL